MKHKLVLSFILGIFCVAAAVHNLRSAPALASDAGPISNTTTASTALNVAGFATGGNGTQGSPWTGWDTRITWTADTKYTFSPGQYYRFSTPIVLDRLDGIEWDGNGATLLYTGTGNAITAMGLVAGADWMFRANLHDFHLDGGGTATNGIYLNIVFNSMFENITVNNVVNTGIKIQGCVGCRFDSILIDSRYAYPAGSDPVHGIWALKHSVGGTVQNTTCAFINCVVEGTSDHGFYFQDMVNTNFIGGYAERCGENPDQSPSGSGYGIYIDSTSQTMTFNSVDVESCPQGCWYIGGAYCVINTPSGYTDGSHNNSMTIAGVDNIVQGGHGVDLTLTNTAFRNRVTAFHTAGTVTDNGQYNRVCFNIDQEGVMPIYGAPNGTTLYPGAINWLTGATSSLPSPSAYRSLGQALHARNLSGGNHTLTGNIIKMDGSIVASVTFGADRSAIFRNDGDRWALIAGGQ